MNNNLSLDSKIEQIAIRVSETVIGLLILVFELGAKATGSIVNNIWVRHSYVSLSEVIKNYVGYTLEADLNFWANIHDAWVEYLSEHCVSGTIVEISDSTEFAIHILADSIESGILPNWFCKPCYDIEFTFSAIEICYIGKYPTGSWYFDLPGTDGIFLTYETLSEAVEAASDIIIMGEDSRFWVDSDEENDFDS